MQSLPPLAECKKDSTALAEVLSTLLEPSPQLDLVVQQLSHELGSLDQCQTYVDIIDRVFDVIGSLDSDTKAAIIAGHPRIGETRNLSILSAKEQAVRATPPDVLERLARLNMAYEEIYPKLRYITFVNGRSRLEIADELEARLALLSKPVQLYGPDWDTELARALNDVKLIAKSRLRTFHVE